MKVSPNAIFNRLIPPAEELWERGGAEIISTEVDPGRYVDVPFFDSQFTSNPNRSLVHESEFRTKSGRLIGRQAVHELAVDGIDYRSRVLIPDDSSRAEHGLTTIDSTAWLTTIDGYVGDRDAKLVIDSLSPLIAVGAAYSASHPKNLKEYIGTPQAAYQSRRLSLAYSAQVEQMIAGHLSEHYDLPRRQIKLGDSRGANITPAQYVYAPHYGNEIVAFDTKGRCAPDKIELADVPEVAAWLGATILGGIAVGGCLLSKGRADLLVGTGSLSPRFVAASLTGTMRTLASGETGQMIDWVPRSARGHEVLYGMDSLADHKQLEQLWSSHPNVVRKVVLSGTHAALLHPQAHSKQRERVRRVHEEYARTNGILEQIDWEYAYGANSKNTLDSMPRAS